MDGLAANSAKPAQRCRLFFYHTIIRDVLDKWTLVALASGDSQETLEGVMEFSATILVFIAAVRFTFFRVYIFLDVVLQLLTVLVEETNFGPFLALFRLVGEGKEHLVERGAHAYLLPISLNMMLNLVIAGPLHEFAGLVKICDFVLELMVSAINASEVNKILLGTNGWSRTHVVVLQLVGIYLLELATWNPMVLVRSFTSEFDVEAVYFISGLVGLTLFFWATRADAGDENKMQRMEADALYKDCASFVNTHMGVGMTTPTMLHSPSETERSPADAEPDAPDHPVVQTAKDYMPVMKIAATALGMPYASTLVSGVLDMSNTIQQAKRARAQVMRWFDSSEASYKVPPMFGNNAANMVAILLRCKGALSYIRMAVLFLMCVFYVSIGFADEWFSIWGQLNAEHKAFIGFVLGITVAFGIVDKVLQMLFCAKTTKTMEDDPFGSFVLDGPQTFTLAVPPAAMAVEPPRPTTWSDTFAGWQQLVLTHFTGVDDEPEDVPIPLQYLSAATEDSVRDLVLQEGDYHLEPSEAMQWKICDLDDELDGYSTLQNQSNGKYLIKTPGGMLSLCHSPGTDGEGYWKRQLTSRRRELCRFENQAGEVLTFSLGSSDVAEAPALANALWKFRMTEGETAAIPVTS